MSFWPFGPFGVGIVGIFLILLFALPAYLVPTIIAAIRKTRHTTAIVLINVFSGWTFLGWVGSLVWAIVDEKRPQKES